MANLTAAAVLSQVDGLLPNGYTTAEKLRWLAQAEGFVQREILGNSEALPAVDTDTVLRVPAPYDELYRHYVEAQIHYSNGETVRYNNAATAWNNAFVTYRDYYNRMNVPPREVKALRFY